MLRRRSRRRSDRRLPPVYVQISPGPERRGRAGRRRRGLAVSAALLVLGAAAAAVAGATSNSFGTRSPKRVAARSFHHMVAPLRPAPPRRPSAGSSITAVLRHTPVVAGGAPHRLAVALTFDDGPSPFTPQIVDILARMHVPATFFVVGQQLKYFAAALRDELRHGMEIGDHTENHAWLVRLGAAAQFAQIHDVVTAVTRLGAPAPRLFRPPYGEYNAATFGILHRLHMLEVLWSVDPGDWRRPGTAAIVRTVLSTARPGAIVELHDGGGNRSQTAAALPAIINGLRRRHYTFATVSQLVWLDPPPRHQLLPGTGGA